jgi:hypothetical protein
MSGLVKKLVREVGFDARKISLEAREVDVGISG